MKIVYFLIRGLCYSQPMLRITIFDGSYLKVVFTERVICIHWFKQPPLHHAASGPEVSQFGHLHVNQWELTVMIFMANLEHLEQKA